MTTWTTERTALLRTLWADGLSGGDIARQLGMTRGMVAGKRHSLGLTPRDRLTTRLAQGRNGRRTAVLCGHFHKDDPAAEAAKAVVVGELLARTAPLRGSNPKPWELRLGGECAFPVVGSGAATWSCCEPVELLRAYCHGHCEILAGRPWPPLDPFGHGLNQWAGA